MKFAIHLAGHLTPEWQSQYIEYRNLKTILYEAAAATAAANNINIDSQNHVYRSNVDDDDVDDENWRNTNSVNNEKFFQYCEQELTKINAFFLEKLSEAKRRFQIIRNEVEVFSTEILSNGKKLKPKRKKSDVKMATSELYLFLVLIQNFQALNYTGFRKILKKHDKLLHTNQGAEWREKCVEKTPLFLDSQVNELIKSVEELFTKHLAAGDRHEAMKKLRVPPLEEKQSPASTFGLGILLGMLLIMIPFTVFTCITLDNIDGILFPWTPAFLLYRSMFLIFFHIILVGINVYGWGVAGINHVLIFEIDPRKHLTYQQVIQIGMFLALCLAVSLLAFIICYNYDVYPFMHPFSLLLFSIFYMINPLPIAKLTSRFWLSFADFWIGDQLTSLTLPFMDLQYFICFYAFNYDWENHSWQNDACRPILIVQAILMSLPAWFRFCQCLRRFYDSKLLFPHVFNALKYSTTFLKATTFVLFQRRRGSFTTVTNNPFFYMYIFAYVLENTYKCIWDIKVDWGFFDKNAGGNRLLREHIVYESKAYYYLAIIENIILRYTWVAGIYLSISKGPKYDQTFRFIAAVLEVIRRHIWNYFRMENEHLNNCGLFRAVRDISIMPIMPDKRVNIEKLMDEPNGVQNRRKVVRENVNIRPANCAVAAAAASTQTIFRSIQHRIKAMAALIQH